MGFEWWVIKITCQNDTKILKNGKMARRPGASVEVVVSCKYLFGAVVILFADYDAHVETGYSHTEERKVFIDDFTLNAFVFEQALDDVGLVYVRIFGYYFHCCQ